MFISFVLECCCCCCFYGCRCLVDPDYGLDHPFFEPELVQGSHFVAYSGNYLSCLLLWSTLLSFSSSLLSLYFSKFSFIVSTIVFTPPTVSSFIQTDSFSSQPWKEYPTIPNGFLLCPFCLVDYEVIFFGS